MYKTKTALLAFALIFIFTTSAFSFGFGTKWMKNYETMQVVDANTGEPIEGAWVVIKWEKIPFCERLNVGGPNSRTTEIIEFETDKSGEFHPFEKKKRYGKYLWINAWKRGYTLGGPPRLTVSRTRGLYSMSGGLKSPTIKLKKLPEGYEGTREYVSNMINVSIFFSGTKWIEIIKREEERASDLWHKKEQ
ncbi:MAG: hypothetical protein Q7J67_07915 [bacterium]|nr:hypothetical protein [bacterium]